MSPYVCSLYFSFGFGLLSGHLLGNSCPVGWPSVLIFCCCLFVIFIYFPFAFKIGISLLIAPIPVHCFSIPFLNQRKHIVIGLITSDPGLITSNRFKTILSEVSDL